MCFAVRYDRNAESFLLTLRDKGTTVQRYKHTRYSKVLQAYELRSRILNICVEGIPSDI